MEETKQLLNFKTIMISVSSSLKSDIILKQLFITGNVLKDPLMDTKLQESSLTGKQGALWNRLKEFKRCKRGNTHH